MTKMRRLPWAVAGFAVVATALLAGTLATAGTPKVTLLLTLVLAGGGVLWTAARTPSLVVRRARLAGALALVVAIAPVDIAFARVGHVGISVHKVRWGYPDRCVIPLNPTRYELVIE